MAAPHNKKGALGAEIFLKGVSLEEKALFAKHLAVMLRAGMPVLEALEIARTSTQGKLRAVIAQLERSVASGHMLSTACARHPKIFPNIFVNVVRAGETSGTLTENLENLAAELEKEKLLYSKIKGALLYPVIVLIAALGLGMMVSFVVLPKIVPLFEGMSVELPASTRMLISFTHIIETSGGILFWSIVGTVVGVGWLVRQQFSQPTTHWILLHLPIIKNLVHYSNLTHFSRTLGMLLKSGVNIDEALEITRSTLTNIYYKRALEAVNLRVSRGIRLTDGLSEYKELFPLMFVRMVHVGEESGKFEESLFYLSELYEDEVDTATKSLSTALEPILLIFIGLVVGFLAISIIMPIYNVTGNIQH